MKQKTAFVSDFDGTITDDDFFTYTTNTYFDEQALAPWREYLAGRKTHFNALKEMFAQIHVPPEQLEHLADSIHADPYLDNVWRLCREKNIPLFVCSAGNDYYIKRILGNRISDYEITVISNKGDYDSENGLVMTAPPQDSPFYDENVGISKYKLVKKLKDEGYFVIFAGDGPPDFEPAKIADTVFARKMLLDKCRQAGIKTEKFDSFKDIYNYIKGL